MNVREITIEPRQYGEDTTLETRAEANETVDRQKRYKQIKEIYGRFGELTAKECAVKMRQCGYSATDERNVSAPRINELCNNGVLEPVGRKKCEYTGKTVTVFALRETE